MQNRYNAALKARGDPTKHYNNVFLYYNYFFIDLSFCADVNKKKEN